MIICSWTSATRMRWAAQLMRARGVAACSRTALDSSRSQFFTRTFSSGLDVWAAATEDVQRGAAPLILVEKVSSVSDGIFDKMQAVQYGPSLLRCILLDADLINLEAPFTRENYKIVAGGDVLGGIGLEDIITSPSIRDAYHENKPLMADCEAQDVTDPTFRPFVTACGSIQNGQVKVRPANDDDDRRATLRDAKSLISGLPITRRVSLQSPEGAVKDALRWLWVRGHVSRDDIKATFTDMTPAQLDGASLLFVPKKPQDLPVRRFKFTHSTFVPGDVRLQIAGMPVQVYVNSKDARERKKQNFDVTSLVFFIGRSFQAIMAMVCTSGVALIVYAGWGQWGAVGASEPETKREA
jgi:hypothetical protein